MEPVLESVLESVLEPVLESRLVVSALGRAGPLFKAAYGLRSPWCV